MPPLIGVDGLTCPQVRAAVSMVTPAGGGGGAGERRLSAVGLAPADRDGDDRRRHRSGARDIGDGVVRVGRTVQDVVYGELDTVLTLLAFVEHVGWVVSDEALLPLLKPAYVGVTGGGLEPYTIDALDAVIVSGARAIVTDPAVIADGVVGVDRATAR